MNVLLLLAGAVSAAPAFPQSTQQPARLEKTEFTVPFDEWVAKGKHKGIPWKIDVSPVELSFDQRLEFAVRAEIPGKKLARLGEAHELYLIARIADEHGHWIEEGWLGMKVSRKPPKDSFVTFRLRFFIIPGKYRMAAVLYDRITGLYSVHTEWIRGQPVKNDPLPLAFSSMPRAQALPPAGSEAEPRFLPGIQSRLALPVKTERPIHFEIILPFRFSNYGFHMTVLNVFSQLRPPEFTYHITVVNPSTRSVLLEQKDVREADWLGLRKTIREINPGVISAQALEGISENAAFLRDILAARMAEPLPEISGQRPLKVFLLIGSPNFMHPPGTVRPSLAPELLGDSLFFQVRQPLPSPRFGSYGRSDRFNLLLESFLVFDHVLKEILKTGNAKRYEVRTPMDFREALADIIRAIEQHPEKPVRVAGANPTL